jgi:type III secretion protein T
MDMTALSPNVYSIAILGFARLYGFMYFFPMISGDQVPPMIRALLCIALTPWVAMPQLSDAMIYTELEEGFYPLLLKEGAVGAVMGLLVGLPLRLPEIIGEIIDNQRGAAVTDTYDPMSGSDASILGQFLSLTFSVYFFTSGGFELLVSMLASSYKLIPMETISITIGQDAWYFFLETFLRYISVFVLLALPVMVVMFLAEIALAIASRFAQSLNVFSLAQPIKALVAISMLIALIPKISYEVEVFIQDMLSYFSG